MAQADGLTWRPEQEIELVAGTPPGGGQDRAARALASGLAEVLDLPVVVSNVPGRGGGNAWESLTAGPGDGYRLSISSPTLVTNPLVGITGTDPAAVTHLAMLCTEHIAFTVGAGSSVSDASRLLNRLADPRSLTVAFATERGNVNHMALAELCRHRGSDPRQLRTRVFDSARQAVADLVAGGSDLAAVTAASVLPELDRRTVEVLAVSSPARLAPPFDVVPTWAELGVDCTIGTWRGVMGPPGLSVALVSFWDRTLTAVVAGRPWHEALVRNHWSDTHMSAEEARRFVAGESARMGTALRALGLVG